MSRLLSYDIFRETDAVNLIAFTDSNIPIKNNVNRYYLFSEFRDKHSNWITLLNMPWNVLKLIWVSLWVVYKYNLKGCITTGPGLAIIPCCIFKLFGIKTIAFESWAKFYTPSLSGKILYRIVDKFVVQHETLTSYYKKASFWGRL